MRKLVLILALNIGGTLGWCAGEYVGIWSALLGSALGSLLFIWLAWRYREYLGG